VPRKAAYPETPHQDAGDEVRCPVAERTEMSEAQNRSPSQGTTPESRRSDRMSRRDALKDECERLLDKELTDTFPASDPPSWTLGGSVVSTLRH
jgi:hypothetical protein